MDIAVKKQEAYEDGIADGAKQKAIETAKTLLKMGILTPEQIAQGTGISLEEVLNLKED